MGNYRSIPGEPSAPPWVSSLLRCILMCPRDVGLVGGKNLLLGLLQPKEHVPHAACHPWAPATASQDFGACCCPQVLPSHCTQVNPGP